jgi:hypothetical protein
MSHKQTSSAPLRVILKRPTEMHHDHDEISRLRHENQALRQTNQKLLARVEQQSVRTTLGDTVIRQLCRMKGRIGLTLAFLRFLQEGQYTSLSGISISPYIRPTLLKQLFELVFHQSTTFKEIDICFTTTPTSDTEKLFDHLKHYLQLCLSIGTECQIKCIPCLEGYTLTEYHLRSSHEIGLSFQKEKEIVMIRLMLYSFDFGESSNEMMTLSSSGITSLHPKLSFLSCLEQLYFKEHYFLTNPSDIQDAAFPIRRSLPYEVKRKHLNEMYQLISGKMLQQLQDGYRLVGTLPCWRMEYTNECPITTAPPPYHVFELKCGHSISMVAYRGIIATPNDFSESLRCPYCRKNLEINFMNLPVSRPETKTVRLQLKSSGSLAIL